MNLIYATQYAAECGLMTIWTYEDKVVMCRWSDDHDTLARSRIMEFLHADSIIWEESQIAVTLKSQLDEYFGGQRKKFDVPTLLVGSDFQKAVWQALARIPYGATITYKEEAEQIGATKAWRAVGSANRNNPMAIIFPCHRVVGSNGELGGYAGGAETKRFLLKLETNNTKGE